MREHSRWMGVGLMLVGFLIALGCWHFNHGKSTADAAAGSAVHVAAFQEDESLLHKLGIILENPGVENKAPLNLIPEGQAVRNAGWSYPALSKAATSVSCLYRLISKPDFSSFSPEALAANPILRETRKLVRTPVYVISFQSAAGDDALSSSAAANLGESRPDGSRETHVVVDAITGVTLMSFSN